jgi:aryl-alcohol dehydrogenase-like predicted oxidoreductase
LEEAFDHGVNWFDLAPAYGAGEAEAIFGRFQRGRRGQVFICSKVGLAPPRRNGMMKLAYGLARPLVGAAQGLRKAFRRVPATRNVSVPLSPELIASSLERSLQQLGTDHLDVFALHKPRHEDILRDEVLRTLERMRRDGKARALAVSGDEQAAKLALSCPEVYGLVQVADDPLNSPLPELQSLTAGRCGIVTHSILGVGGSLERLQDALRSTDPTMLEAMRADGYAGDPAAIASQLLVDRSLAANRQGVVLLSMFGERHRAANLSRAAQPPRPEAAGWVTRLLGGREGDA